MKWIVSPSDRIRARTQARVYIVTQNAIASSTSQLGENTDRNSYASPLIADLFSDRLGCGYMVSGGRTWS